MRVEELPLYDEHVLELRNKDGSCKAGYLFWPCFYIKLLVLWDGKPDFLVKIGNDLWPDYEQDVSAAYAWVWDFECNDPSTPAKDYVSASDMPVTHALVMSKRPQRDADGMRGAIAHEAMHISIAALNGRGLKLCEASEEAYTYQMESIVERTLAIMKVKPWKRIRI